jgi:hypothetical protein
VLRAARVTGADIGAVADSGVGILGRVKRPVPTLALSVMYQPGELTECDLRVSVADCPAGVWPRWTNARLSSGQIARCLGLPQILRLICTDVVLGITLKARVTVLVRGGGVEVRISFVAGDREDGLESLSDWLRAEPELAGRISLTAAEPRPGELGAAVDALVAAVGSGGALSVLAMSLNAWLSQPRRSDVRIRVEGETGRVVEIDADRVDSDRVEALVRQALGRASEEQ